MANACSQEFVRQLYRTFRETRPLSKREIGYICSISSEGGGNGGKWLSERQAASFFIETSPLCNINGPFSYFSD